MLPVLFIIKSLDIHFPLNFISNKKKSQNIFLLFLKYKPKNLQKIAIELLLNRTFKFD